MTVWCGSTDPSHRSRGCKPCGMLYQRQRKAKAFGDPAQGVKWKPSKLNRRVDAAYAKCAGKHVPSTVYVTRQHNGREANVPECRKCRVPMVPWKVGERTPISLPGTITKFDRSAA